MSFDNLTRYLDSLAETYGMPSVDCKVTLGADAVYRHSAGFADFARQRPVTPDTLYYIYSATKVITMTAVMQLAERGLIRLSDRLDQYLPEFHAMRRFDRFPEMSPLHSALPDGSPLPETVPVQTPIRIEQLMSMTAGLTYDIQSREIQALRASTGDQATTRQMMAALAAMPLAYEPGTRWLYSLAHDVLAGVVEAVSGLNFADYLRANIFQPLGMEDAYFDLNAERRERLCAQYTGDGADGPILPAEPFNRYRLSERYESGGAGILCTVDAYSLFAQAMSNGGVGAAGQRILTMASIDQMRLNRLSGQPLLDFQAFGNQGYGYGLGVRTLLDTHTAKSPAGEFGWDGAAGAYTLIDPVNHVSIFMAKHVLNFPRHYSEIHPTVRDLTYEALFG